MDGRHPFVKHDNLKSGTFNTLRGVFVVKYALALDLACKEEGSGLHPAQLINSPDET